MTEYQEYQWGMNADSQLLFKECGINCIDTFKLLNNSDIDKVFFERHMLGEKLIFREKFEKWKSKSTISAFFYTQHKEQLSLRITTQSIRKQSTHIH